MEEGQGHGIRPGAAIPVPVPAAMQSVAGKQLQHNHLQHPLTTRGAGGVDMTAIPPLTPHSTNHKWHLHASH